MKRNKRHRGKPLEEGDEVILESPSRRGVHFTARSFGEKKKEETPFGCWGTRSKRKKGEKTD